MRTVVTLVAVICLVGVAFGQPPREAPKPGPEHQKLGIWLGDWQYEGEVQDSPMGPAGKVVGKMTVRPVLGGLFVEFRNEETGPTGTIQYLEVDGYDPVNKIYTWKGFASDGCANAVTYTIDGTKVSYSGTMSAGGKQYQIRGTIVFTADFTSDIEKREYSADGKTWAPLFEGKFTKVKAAEVASTSVHAGQEVVNISADDKARAPASRQLTTPLQELGDLLVGRWTSDVTWAVDYPGLGQKGEKVTGFDVWRRTADGRALECDWLLGATCGRTLLWWDASAQQIRTLDINSGGNWAQGTVTKRGTKWAWATAGRFADGRRVEYQSETTFADDGRSRVDAGATILDGVRNEFRDTFKRVTN